MKPNLPPRQIKNIKGINDFVFYILLEFTYDSDLLASRRKYRKIKIGSLRIFSGRIITTNS